VSNSLFTLFALCFSSLVWSYPQTALDDPFDKLPLFEEEEDSVSFRSLFYLQRDGPDHKGGNPNLDEDEFVYEGVAVYDKSLNEQDHLNLQLSGGIIASSLPVVASGKRISLQAGYSRDFDSFKAGGLLGGSFEVNEFGSVLYGSNLSWPLDENRMTLGFRFDGSADIYGDKWRQSFSITPHFLLILNKRNLLSLNVDYAIQFGALETNYYSVLVDDDEFVENMPHLRNKGAIAGRWKHNLNELTSMELAYRFYADDWSIVSHTLEATFYQNFFRKHLLFEPSARLHIQSGAFFFRREFSDLPELRSSDSDLGPFKGLVLSLKASLFGLWFFPLWLDNLSVSGSYWLRNDGFHIFWIDFGLVARI